jgi:hypothetical protein
MNQHPSQPPPVPGNQQRLELYDQQPPSTERWPPKELYAMGGYTRLDVGVSRKHAFSLCQVS